jgi:succinyl-CoA synthetase alpha subunit
MMNSKVVVRRNFYFDSFSLMKISSELKKVAGIREAMVCMGTDLNKAFLRSVGLLGIEAELATINDLIIAVNGENEEAATEGMKKAEGLLLQKVRLRGGTKVFRPRTLENALKRFPEANLILMSIPGNYVRREAEIAIKKGLHVLIFSDNVPIKDEIELKKLGQKEGLLVMGPDCGTAIIHGTALGFANAVRKGPIGIIGASGTGIQELSVILDKLGVGISQAIGTGGRDLLQEVGGITTQMAIEAMNRDPETKVIVFLAKAFDKQIGEEILHLLKRTGKPAIVNLMGGPMDLIESVGLEGGSTLEETAFKAALKVSKEIKKETFITEQDLTKIVESETRHLSSSQKYLRALFSGGSLCVEAVSIFSQVVRKRIYTNIHHKDAEPLPDLEKSIEHTMIDLGDDFFTRGRAHPMIDPRIRIERLLKEAEDPEIAVVLLDIILGYGSSSDMAGSLLPAIIRAREMSESRGGYLPVVVNLCGTEEDPQNLEEQKGKLSEVGVVVLPTNALATRVAAQILIHQNQIR